MWDGRRGLSVGLFFRGIFFLTVCRQRCLLAVEYIRSRRCLKTPYDHTSYYYTILFILAHYRTNN